MELSEENEFFINLHNLLWQQRRRREAFILITLLMLFHVTGFWTWRLGTQSEMIHSVIREIRRRILKTNVSLHTGQIPQDRVHYNNAQSCQSIHHRYLMMHCSWVMKWDEFTCSLKKKKKKKVISHNEEMRKITQLDLWIVTNWK